jgi:phosphate starvation-inducible PhoH-like protein
MLKPKKKSKRAEDVMYIPERPTKLLRPKNEPQARLISAIYNKDIILAVGPAGTGKTYVSAAKSIDFLQANIVSTIILTRPYVPAGEKLGFIPGTVEDKLAPYLEPYMDAFVDRIGKQAVNLMLTDGRIQAKPIAFLQGKTFNDAIILVDEAENATLEQIKLILTRMGENCKCILMGDHEQIYIPNSGLAKAVQILKDVPKLDIVEFLVEDCIRSETCRHVLEAFERAK